MGKYQTFAGVFPLINAHPPFEFVFRACRVVFK